MKSLLTPLKPLEELVDNKDLVPIMKPFYDKLTKIGNITLINFNICYTAPKCFNMKTKTLDFDDRFLLLYHYSIQEKFPKVPIYTLEGYLNVLINEIQQLSPLPPGELVSKILTFDTFGKILFAITKLKYLTYYSKETNHLWLEVMKDYNGPVGYETLLAQEISKEKKLPSKPIFSIINLLINLQGYDFPIDRAIMGNYYTSMDCESIDNNEIFKKETTKYSVEAIANLIVGLNFVTIKEKYAFFTRFWKLFVMEECETVEEIVKCASIKIPNYLPIKKKAEGSRVDVYKALDLNEETGGEIVAVKVEKGGGNYNKARQIADEKYAKTGIEMERINRANRKIENFKHLVKLFYAGRTEDDKRFYIEEYIEGPNLEQIIYSKDKDKPNEPLKIEVVEEIFKQLLDAVGELHSKGMIHRDLKLDNIILCDRNFNKIKLGDLEFCTEVKGGVVEGVTPFAIAYASPELIIERRASFQSDIYALGIILYELIAGKKPFDFYDELRHLRDEREELLQTEIFYKRIGQEIKDININIKSILDKDKYTYLLEEMSINYLIGRLRDERIPDILIKLWAVFIAKCLSYAPEERFRNISEVRHYLFSDINRFGKMSLYGGSGCLP